jgi:hypothetical protein
MRVAFVSDKLDGMPSGTVELNVPLIGGVIQIGRRWRARRRSDTGPPSAAVADLFGVVVPDSAAIPD